MPQNQFSGTGILDGQIVEANQVSQSVDAFTGAKDYRITLTGSMELSGSLLMSGSFINGYTGQFSTLGLGVAAPTAPTMLYIKDTSAGGDPAIIMEATTGNDSARIRLKNPDVEYDLGAFGSSGDDFMVVQDTTSSPRFPFIVGKDTVSYTLYAVDDSVGVGLGSNTKVILNPLDAGSLQAAGRVSGSSMRAGTISASAAGENIHGTASYATYIETAQTASYVKANDVDFYFSVSQQINSAGEIAGLSGSYNALKISDVSGLSIKNIGQNDYSTVLSGSVAADAGLLYFGDVEGGEYLTFNQEEQFIKAETSTFEAKTTLKSSGNIILSGSDNSVSRYLVVGPNTTSGTINAQSSSLSINALMFNSNVTSYLSNNNSSGTSKLALNVGGLTNSKIGLELSSSQAVTIPNNKLILKSATQPTTYQNWTPYEELNVNDNSMQCYRIPVMVNNTTSNTNVYPFSLITRGSEQNWEDADQMLEIKWTLMGQCDDATSQTRTRRGFYGTLTLIVNFDTDNQNTAGWRFEPGPGGTNTVTKVNGTSIANNDLAVISYTNEYNSTNMQYEISGTGTNIDCYLNFKFDTNTSTATKWTSFFEIKRMFTDTSS
tara:strand:- start:632 stop:2443 length:1812 start_codon:yes stop_codon:yes gene_type:complete